MLVTAHMIEFVLRKQGIDVHVLGNADCEIERIGAFGEGAREPGVLYVSRDREPRMKPTAKSKYALLCSESEPAEALLEEASAALRAIDLWDAKLKDALLDRASLSKFMAIGSEMLSCPIAYFDRNLITLASSDDYWDYGNAQTGGLRVSGQMPSNRAVDLVDDLDYLDAASKLEPFYYENARNRIFLGINTFDDGEYLARLVLALPEGETHLHPGEEQLAVHYHRYLDDLYLHYGGNVDVVSSQNDALHTLAHACLLEPQAPPAAEIASILRSYGWSANDKFVVAKLVFFEGVHWDTISLYLCGLLERAVSASCAFPIERQIVWLINLTRSQRAEESPEEQLERLMETLVAMIRDYACKAGISDTFSPFTKAHSYYMEAEYALDIGQTRDPHYWYYRFSDYSFDYLLSRSTEDLPAELLCHPALATLRTYDTAHGTEYARTLICFLRNSQNTTHAANELFIHRTSFMRRMAQIQNLVRIDLDDPDEVLYLLLSAKLLGM